MPAIADTTVTFPEKRSQREQPRGAERHLVLQGRVSFALLQFDTAPLKGLSTTRATLRVHAAPSPVPLHTAGISTISGNGPWTEPEATFYRPARETWWSYPRSELADVTFAQGGSLYVYPRVRDAGDGWFEIDVPPQIVAALATGDQFGIMLTDEKGQTQTRHVLSSREGAHAPVLMVEAEKRHPAEVGRLRTRVIGDRLILEGARARIDLRYAQAAISDFASASPYPRWRIDSLAPKPHPLATSNTLSQTATVSLKGLAPGTYFFAARTMDETGTASPPVHLGPVRIDAPVSRELPPAPSASGSPAAERRQVWAASDTVKFNPVTGALLEKGHIWTDGVKLTAARNEFVAFQVAVEGPQSNVTVEISKPLFATNKLPVIFRETGATQLYREWFVPDDKKPGVFYPDPLVPLTGPFDIPSKDNPVPDQKVQPVFVDIYVPHDATPGLHQGELRVRSASGLDHRLPIEVTVLPLSLPDKLSFVVDLNCYGGVEGPQRGTPEYRAVEHTYHRVAHLHRTNLDILGYSQNGTLTPDHAPPLTGEGAQTRVADWTAWDEHWGPLVSGALFRDMPRAGVPAPAMYLPFFENWPGEIHEHYRAHDPAVPSTLEEYNDLIRKHALTAGPVEEEFSKSYQDRFSAVALDFARHIKSRGWNTDTKYVVYFNNKYYQKRPPSGAGSSWWLLDEPNHRDDFRAISFLGWLAMRRLDEAPDSGIIFRTDISRIDWMRDLLTGQVDLNAISRRFHERTRLLQDRERFGTDLWNYATTNHPRDTNVMLRAWAWRVWLNGGNGLLPWVATRTRNAWERAEPLTVFYSGEKFGQTEPFASLRLKAYRRGQQDIEFLNLLANSDGWSRDVLTRAIREALDLSANVDETFEEDAGTLRFDRIQDADLENLRRRVISALLPR